MRVITSVTVFHDAVGLRMSATYSEVDDATGLIVNDNKRIDRVITGDDAKASAQALMTYAESALGE